MRRSVRLHANMRAGTTEKDHPLHPPRKFANAQLGPATSSCRRGGIRYFNVATSSDVYIDISLAGILLHNILL
jgi:hypothetical protein